MKNIRIVYIDDQIDNIIGKYIKEKYCSHTHFKHPNIIKVYEEFEFESEKGYESVLASEKIRRANIILVDYHLYEERLANTGKFSGKQFKAMFRKLFPYVEVILITQDTSLEGSNIIQKFHCSENEASDTYYETKMDPILDIAIEKVLEYESHVKDLSENKEIEKFLVEKIVQSFNGDSPYDMLSKKDIDEFITGFQQMRESYEKKSWLSKYKHM